MSNSLFVYGTLMIPEIQFALLGKVLESEEACLPDYGLYTLRYSEYETEYPVLKPLENAEVKGLILYFLDEYDLQLLSYYEGSEYFLKELEVPVSVSLKRVKTFFPTNISGANFGGVWQIENFRKRHLSSYLNTVIPDTLSEFKLLNKK